MEYLSGKELEDYKNASEVEKLRLVNLIAKNIIERKSNIYKWQNELHEFNDSSISGAGSTLSFGDETSLNLNHKTEIPDPAVEEYDDEQEEINCETFRVEESTANKQHLPRVDNNWGGDISTMNENQFGYVMEYLKKTNELITQAKELKQLSTPSSYQVVDSTNELFKSSNSNLQSPSPPLLWRSNCEGEVLTSQCFHEADETELKTHRPCNSSSQDIDVFSPLQDVKQDDDHGGMQCEDDQLSMEIFKNKIENIKKDIFRNLLPEDAPKLLLERNRELPTRSTANENIPLAASVESTKAAAGDSNDLSILKLVCEMELLSQSITSSIQLEGEIPKLKLNELSADDNDLPTTSRSEPSTMFDYPLNRPQVIDTHVEIAAQEADIPVDETAVKRTEKPMIGRVKSATRIPRQISLLSTANHRWSTPTVTRWKARRRQMEHRETIQLQNVVENIDDNDLSNWLPNEIWLHIFSYLTRTDLRRVGSTCSRLYAIASDRTLWRRIHLRSTPLSDGLLRILGARSPKQIKFERCDASGISNAGLRKLFHGCKNSLESFAVDKCVGKQLAGDNIFLHVSCHCANLTSIAVPWTAVSNDGLSALVSAVRCLREIDISGNSLVTDESFCSLVRQHRSTLTSVNMEGCFNVSPYTILRLCQEAHNLLQLNIALCSKISNDVATKLCSVLTRLECFDAHGVKAIDDRCLEIFASNSPHLHTLIIGNCSDVTDRGVSAFARHKLKHLDISNCSHASDESLMRFQQTFGLHHLDVSSSSITSSLIVWLATNAPSLQTLKLSYCRDVNQLSLEGLVRWNQNLVSLHVYGCKQVRISILSKLNSCLIVEK